MVYEVMTPEVLCCLETDDVKEAALIMEENQLRRILVLNESKHLVGIISLGELVTATGDRLLAGKILESVSDPSENKATADEIELEEGSDRESNNEQGGEISGQTTVAEERAVEAVNILNRNHAVTGGVPRRHDSYRNTCVKISMHPENILVLSFSVFRLARAIFPGSENFCERNKLQAVCF